MDNQFPNISGGTPDNQTPETDIFKEQPSEGTIVSEGITETENSGEAAGSLNKERNYTDPNSGYGQSGNLNQNGGQNYNQGSPSYGGGQYQQPVYTENRPDYEGSSNAGYRPNYEGSVNAGYQPNYGSSPNAGYQQANYGSSSNTGYQQPNYGGNPNTGYPPNYNGNSNTGYQSNYVGVPNAGYQQPNYGNNLNSPYDGMDTSPMTMGDWLLTLLACAIPCAGTILSLIWAFGKHGNVNRRNFCRAQLIITGVVIVLYIIVVIIWGVSIAGALSTY